MFFLMLDSYPYPDYLHLDHRVGKDLTIGLLNSIIDHINSLNNCLESLNKSIENYSKQLR